MTIGNGAPFGAAAVMVLALVAGCHRSGPPRGQVVAVVEGHEVTRRDVQAELAAANLPADTDVTAIQPQVVSDLVNRKLLVLQAKQQGLDKNPDYLAAVSRADELVLAQQLVASWLRKQPAPTAAEASAFAAANPQIFADRKLFLLDQIRARATGLDSKALAPLQTMAAVADYLRAHNIAFQRGNATLDTAQMPVATARQIAGLAPGMPFVSTRAGTVFVSAVLETRPEPVPEAQQAALAMQALQQQTNGKVLADHVKSLRAGAKISYQPGFAPPAGAPGQ